jgi:hypothetical protein
MLRETPSLASCRNASGCLFERIPIPYFDPYLFSRRFTAHPGLPVLQFGAPME